MATLHRSFYILFSVYIFFLLELCVRFSSAEETVHHLNRKLLPDYSDFLHLRGFRNNHQRRINGLFYAKQSFESCPVLLRSFSVHAVATYFVLRRLDVFAEYGSHTEIMYVDYAKLSDVTCHEKAALEIGKIGHYSLFSEENQTILIQMRFSS